MKFWLLFFTAFLGLTNSQAQTFLEMAGLNPSTQYRHFETEHFEFTFQEGYDSFALEAAKHLEHAHIILSPFMKWNPRARIHVLVADNTDSANGFAMASLRVGMVLYPIPPDQWYSTSYTENWIKLLTFHEYTHILNLDPTTEWMEALRIVFGDIIRPNSLWPMWMLEGLAVYFETRTSILGRGRSPYYDAIVRAYYNEHRLGISSDQGMTYGRLSGPWPYFPGGETPYLFGYHLWNQLFKDTQSDLTAGEYSIRSSHRVPFFIDGNLENVTGKKWGEYWDRFIQESSARYSKEIEIIRAKGETRSTLITQSGFNAMGGSISPDGNWLAYTETRLDERQGLTLKNLKSGQEKKIRDKVQGALVTFTPDSRFLIFSSLGRNTTFTEFSDLWAYDLQKDSFKPLSSGLRAKDPQLSPDGNWLIYTSIDHGTHVIGRARWDQQNHALSNPETIFKPDEFSILGAPRWIDSNELVFSIQKLNQAESIVVKWNVHEKGMPIPLVANGKMNRFPVVCNGKVFHVSDQTGIDNLFHGDRKISEVITALQFPFCSPTGDIYASLLTSHGFEIAKIEIEDSKVSTETVARPSAPETLKEALHSPIHSSTTPSIESYRPFSTLAPRQWAPFGNLNYDGISGVSLGGQILGFDATGKHQYLGSFSYQFKSRTLDQAVSYTYYGFRPSITLAQESTTFDLANDPSGLFYKRTHELSLSFSHLIQWTWSSMQITPTFFADWNSEYQLGSSQKVRSTDPEFRYPMVPGGTLSAAFSDEIFSKLGFMAEGGSRITGATQARIYQDSFTLWKYLLEYQTFLSPGSHHVFNPKLRYFGSSHPYGWDRSYALLKGKRTDDLTDRGTDINLKRMQIRGYPNMSIRTKAAIQAGLDYHFPLDAIFNGSGPVFFRQAHGFIFGEATHIPSTRFRNLYLPAFGLGLIMDTTLFWHLPVSVSLEMHYGTKTDFGGAQSFFVSLSYL